MLISPSAAPPPGAATLSFPGEAGAIGFDGGTSEEGKAGDEATVNGIREVRPGQAATMGVGYIPQFREAFDRNVGMDR